MNLHIDFNESDNTIELDNGEQYMTISIDDAKTLQQELEKLLVRESNPSFKGVF